MILALAFLAVFALACVGSAHNPPPRCGACGSARLAPVSVWTDECRACGRRQG